MLSCLRTPGYFFLLAAALGAQDLRELITRYERDHEALRKFYPLAASASAKAALSRFQTASRSELAAVEFDKLDIHGRVDYLLLRNRIERHERAAALLDRQMAEIAPLIPFAPAIHALCEARQRVDPLDAAKAAAALAQMARQVEALPRKIAPLGLRKPAANRAARTTEELRKSLREWFEFYHGYDPEFTWWMTEPHKQLDAALDKYAAFLREELVGIKKGDKDTIVGDPVGSESIVSSLALEMIPYSPEELIALADKELAWCDREMLRASRELGYGDDWRKALEHVKTQFVPPGQQPALVKKLAVEAIDYVEKNNLVTVPPVARELWRMRMMTPERQRINPFFTGGEEISVSFPVDAMTHEQKMMSLRGNNRHFARATVFHELIPGHHLQQYMTERYRPYRSAFDSPFWIEGWALYWEMLLWDRGFHASPEDRIGALFWRMFRCARILFSLRFHLGLMTAPEAVEFLVTRVGHERENAMAEVRRSVEDASYDPLYQAAYMLGGLQIRALRRELVEPGKMTDRAFHDAILQLNSIPIELIRATLTGQPPLRRDYRPSWRFYE